MDGLSEVFQALAHGHRRDMIHALALRPHSISELAERQELSLPAIHKHIRVLEDAGMVRRRKTGRTTFLALRREPLDLLQAWVGQFHPEWGTDQESLANYADHLEHHPTAAKEPT
ncbi:MAG: metalloregulator ArsR/SmtB family transcription factor [Jiangellales bacterium]